MTSQVHPRKRLWAAAQLVCRGSAAPSAGACPRNTALRPAMRNSMRTPPLSFAHQRRLGKVHSTTSTHKRAWAKGWGWVHRAASGTRLSRQGARRTLPSPISAATCSRPLLALLSDMTLQTRVAGALGGGPVEGGGPAPAPACRSPCCRIDVMLRARLPATRHSPAGPAGPPPTHKVYFGASPSFPSRLRHAALAMRPTSPSTDTRSTPGPDAPSPASRPPRRSRRREAVSYEPPMVSTIRSNRSLAAGEASHGPCTRAGGRGGGGGRQAGSRVGAAGASGHVAATSSVLQSAPVRAACRSVYMPGCTAAASHSVCAVHGLVSAQPPFRSSTFTELTLSCYKRNRPAV